MNVRLRISELRRVYHKQRLSFKARIRKAKRVGSRPRPAEELFRTMFRTVRLSARGVWTTSIVVRVDSTRRR